MADPVIRKDGWQPTSGVWRLYLVQPTNPCCGLRFRLWIRLH